jgi:hypothetical protein
MLKMLVIYAVALCLISGCGSRTPTSATNANESVPPAPTSPIRLVDVAPTSGLTYVWPKQPRPIGTRETFGCGCAFLDYDNDGWQDILLVARPHPILYRNLGNGRFEDVTAKMGLSQLKGFWTGCAVGDYNGDGYVDVLLTGYQRLALLENMDGKRFKDVTVSAGLDPYNHGNWGSSAGFMDLAGKGRLDLVVLNYAVLKTPQDDYCQYTPTLRTACAPSHYRAEYPNLYENMGDGRFKDVTAPSGIDASNGKGLDLAFIDLSGTGRQSFFIGNDGMYSDFMENEGGMRLTDIGQQIGLAATESGTPISAMSADWADYSREGRLDLFVSNFSQQPFQLFHNLGSSLFEHTETQLGIAVPPYVPLGFGAKWADIDNDGWPDILCACGHVYEHPFKIDGFSKFRQPLILYYNEQGSHFVDLAPQLKGDLERPIVGRGMATGDYLNNGNIDFVVVDIEGPVMLLRNFTQTSNHWITLDLHSDSYNHFAYGAEITAHTGKNVWISEVSPASSYMSSSDPRVHFGLGPDTKLTTVDIRWPSGKHETLKDLQADHIWRIDEGHAARIENPKPPSP